MYPKRWQAVVAHASKTARYIYYLAYRQSGKTTFIKNLNADFLLDQKLNEKTEAKGEDVENLIYGSKLKQTLSLYRPALETHFKKFGAKFNSKMDHILLHPPFGSGNAYIKFFGTDTGLEEGRTQQARGQTASGAIFCDEYGDWPPAFFQAVVRPQGDVYQTPFFITGTPRGPNHFKYDFERAEKKMLSGDKDYFAFRWTIKDALDHGEVTQKFYDQTREDNSGPYQYVWDAEYMLSFDAYNPGQVFSAELGEAESEGRIGNFSQKYNLPVECFWDIGTNGTAVWFCQRVRGMILMVAYLEDLQNVTFQKFIRQTLKPFMWDNNLVADAHYFPHDISYKDWSSEYSRMNIAIRELRRPCHKMRPVKVPAEDIDIAKRHFKNCAFDKVLTQAGRNRLSLYKTKNGKPVKDENSHGADAFIMALNLYKDVPFSEKGIKSRRRDLISARSSDYYTHYGPKRPAKPWFIA